MATYYVDPSATGSDNGTSQANAWTTLQRAIDGSGVGATKPTAGDTVLCKGSETLSANVDTTTGNTGTAASFVKYIGVNSSWINDGTKYAINGGASGYKLTMAPTVNYYWWENFSVTHSGAAAHAIQARSGSDGHVLINCSAVNAGDRGFQCAGSATLFRCVSTGATNEGFYLGTGYSVAIACRASGSGLEGFELGDDGARALGCVSYENTGDGFQVRNGAFAAFCVADANTDGFYIEDARTVLYGCRATNGTNGIDVAASQRVIVGLLYTGGNSVTELDGDNEQLSIDGAAHVTTEGSDTDHGYVDSSSDDYNLDPDNATYYSEQVVIP